MSSTINITGNTILDSPYEAFQFQNRPRARARRSWTSPTLATTSPA